MNKFLAFTVLTADEQAMIAVLSMKAVWSSRSQSQKLNTSGPWSNEPVPGSVCVCAIVVLDMITCARPHFAATLFTFPSTRIDPT